MKYGFVCATEYRSCFEKKTTVDDTTRGGISLGLGAWFQKRTTVADTTRGGS